MTKKIYLTLLSVFLSLFCTYAQLSQTVTVSQPGTLSQSLGDNKTKVTDLILLGTINAQDFQTIKQMTSLKNLDMAGVKIDNNTIPSNAFQGRVMNKIILPSSVVAIGDYSFSSSKLSSTLVLPSSLEKLGGSVFQGMVVPSLDLQGSKNSLSSIGVLCFSNLQQSAVSQTLDFRAFTKLSQFGTGAWGGNYYGVFSEYTGHVILPETMKDLPANSFALFRGTVEFPAGLKSLGSGSFRLANLSSPLLLPANLVEIGDYSFSSSKLSSTLVLPSSLEKLGSSVFQGMVVPSLDLQGSKNSLSSIGVLCFSNLQQSAVSQTLDFRAFTKLSQFGTGAWGGNYYGVFSEYTGHVILPKTMKDLPANSFALFRGTVEFPAGLKSLGSGSFRLANLSSPLLLPANLVEIGDYSFSSTKLSSTLVLPSSLEKLGSSVFQGMVVPSLDLQGSKNSLSSIGVLCFSNLQQSAVSQTLDFRAFTKLSQFGTGAWGGNYYGVFSEYTGHVILPKTMKDLPANSFALFRGTVEFPAGLKSLGSGSFRLANLSSPLLLPANLVEIGDHSFSSTKLSSTLVLPSSLEKLGSSVFQGMVVPSLDLQGSKNSLSSIGVLCFSNLQQSAVSQTLDFRAFTKLSQFGTGAWGGNHYGVFSEYAGHVILPETMKDLPANSFALFRGTVDLPEGLRTIGVQAFLSSTIKTIDLPASVTSIGYNTFNNCTRLEEIWSRNATPPTLGSNVFYGVNKQTTKLLVPETSITLYGKADQWKDFLNVKPTIPSKVNLLYKINPASWTTIDQKDDNIEVSYQGIRIGEYYWMTKNFNHKEPKRTIYVQQTVLSGLENDLPMTQDVLDKYLNQMDTKTDQYQVDIDQYTEDYGVYYQYDTRNYMTDFGKIFENNNTEFANWNLPKVKDFHQLIAMSPFRAQNTTTELSVYDAMAALAAGPSANPMSAYRVIGACGGDFSYWQGFGAEGGKKTGFDLMPSGNRLNGNGPWGTEICGEILNRYGDTGDLIQLFHVAEFPAQDGFIHLHEIITTKQVGYDSLAIDYHWLPIRWCRALSDEELGYKLYIKIDNINKNSKEWKEFADNQYEILLLNYMRNNKIPTDQTSIVKLGLKDVPPAGYIELPHGYIRGFYVQYILDKLSPTVTVSDIMEYAYNVQESALEFTQEDGRKPAVEEIKVPYRMISDTNDFSTSISIYPNPVVDVLNISGGEVEKVLIYDLSGRQVAKSVKSNTISVRDLTRGSYIVKVTTSAGESTHKIMKQ